MRVFMSAASLVVWANSNGSGNVALILRFPFCEKTVEPQLQTSCEQLSRVIPGSWDHREPGAMARLKALSSLASLPVLTGQLTLWAVAESACCQCSLYVMRTSRDKERRPHAWLWLARVIGREQVSHGGHQRKAQLFFYPEPLPIGIKF